MMTKIPYDITALDHVNAALLPLIRHHLSALQGSNPLAWRHAFQIATERWGEARGLALANRTQLFLSALLACRPVPLDATDPFDLEKRAALTDDEAILMAIMTAMRIDDTNHARSLMTQITGGRITAAAVQTGLSLALLLETPTAIIRRPAAPKLRAVS